jgi:hypothetical protein
MTSNPLYQLFNRQRLMRDIIGTVWEVNGHGIHLDHDGAHYTVAHMDTDGKVIERNVFATLNDAAYAVAMLKRELEQTTIFIPDRKLIQ